MNIECIRSVYAWYFRHLQSTLALCIKRDVNDWAHHTPTKVFLPHTHILTPLTLKGYPYSFLWGGMTLSLFTEVLLHPTIYFIWPKDCCSKSYLSDPIFCFRLHHNISCSDELRSLILVVGVRLQWRTFQNLCTLLNHPSVTTFAVCGYASWRYLGILDDGKVRHGILMRTYWKYSSHLRRKFGEGKYLFIYLNQENLSLYFFLAFLYSFS